ncbi:hypothetical protein [Fulvivirga sedimenti]|uniref:Uncharacterized protein n=1 Tax=Fulvivirga sedimenti TaxID=2879465 RepID=A0A9X1KZC2_9BACT|nr:hypothetical protein [Fulvivirga sedimenti]MCA6078753.1 hypothetical protein [Fulvivirga sedimenti]
MSRQKRIFIILAILFFAAMAYVAYDISSRTTFPGSKPQLKERIEKQYNSDESIDSAGVKRDTVTRR